MRHKIQSSIEFLLIASAISILCFTATTFYAKNISVNFKTINTLLSIAGTNNYTEMRPISNKPGFLTYFPMNSRVDNQSSVQMYVYGCSSGIANIRFISNSILFNADNVSIRFDGVGFITNLLEPLIVGKNLANISYEIICNSSVLQTNRTYYTYSDAYDNANKTKFKVSIFYGNESILYRMSNTRIFSSVYDDSGCSDVNFFGNPYGVAVQCGTANAWDFRLSTSQCLQQYVYTITYCLYPQSSGYSIGKTETSNITPRYSFNLVVKTRYGNMTARLSNNDQTSNVLLDGEVVGYAKSTVLNINNFTNESYLVYNSSRIITINYSQYMDYVQEFDSINQMLYDYNNTQISYPIRDLLLEDLSKLSNIVNSIVNENVSASKCSMDRTHYVCNIDGNFDYIINITLNKELGITNTTTYYNGSVIKMVVK